MFANIRIVRMTALLVALALGLVIVHDSVATHSQFQMGWLCQRADGSLWRDPSFGCASDDPRCWPKQCAPSEHLSEGWRHACTWLLFRSETRPTGPPPYYRGDSPGAGCPGRDPALHDVR